MRLARPSHQIPATRPYAHESTALCCSSASQRTASTPAALRSSKPCISKDLRPLATKSGDTFGLGHVVAQERLRRGLTAQDVASRLGLTSEEYEALEAGDNGTLDDIAMLLVNFNEIIESQVHQLFYPCEMPFHQART